MMTEWYWSGTLYAFARVCNLRCVEDAQYETRIVANFINDECKELFHHGKNYETHKYNYILNYHGGLYGRQSVGLIRQLTELGLAIIALVVLWFRCCCSILRLDIVGSVVALVKHPEVKG